MPLTTLPISLPFPLSSSSSSTALSSTRTTLCPAQTIVSAGTVSTRPRSKKAVAHKERLRLEADELVRYLLSKSGADGEKQNQPLVSTLNKYVRVVRTDHCFLLFEELGRKGRWLQCLEVFRWMQKQRWYVADNGIYSKLISVMGKQGQIRMAMWLFSEMRNSGCKPDTSVYNALVTAHLHSQDKVKALAKAFGYFEKMKNMERCQPNIVTYNIILRACAQAGDTKKVEELFKDLEESIVSPDIYTFNGVMDGYGKNGMLKEMETTLLRMKSNQCKPDIITFNLLIDAYGKRQAFDKMEQVFLSLLRSKEKPTLPTFNSMIISYGKARLREKAESILEKMKDLGLEPGYITNESLITTYGYCDCVFKARKIFDEMISSEREVRISTLNVMLDVYCKNNLPDEADQLLDYAKTKGLLPNSSTYKLLYRAYTKANRKELLEKLITLMDERGIVPNKNFFLESLKDFTAKKSKCNSNNAVIIASNSKIGTK